MSIKIEFKFKYFHFISNICIMNKSFVTNECKREIQWEDEKRRRKSKSWKRKIQS